MRTYTDRADWQAGVYCLMWLFYLLIWIWQLGLALVRQAKERLKA